MSKEEIEKQLKLSKRQSKDERYDYLCSEFNAINYCINLEKYTNKLQQENKQLKEIIKENTILVKDEYGDYQECNIKPLEMKQKYEKLKDNWNKLKEYLNYKSERSVGEDEYVYDEIYNKMQELQGDDKN